VVSTAATKGILPDAPLAAGPFAADIGIVDFDPPFQLLERVMDQHQVSGFAEHNNDEANQV
jgi:hypothetical protein